MNHYGPAGYWSCQAARARRREKGLPSSESEDDGEAIMDDGKDYKPPEPVKEEPAKKGKKRKKKAPILLVHTFVNQLCECK